MSEQIVRQRLYLIVRQNSKKTKGRKEENFRVNPLSGTLMYQRKTIAVNTI